MEMKTMRNPIIRRTGYFLAAFVSLLLFGILFSQKLLAENDVTAPEIKKITLSASSVPKGSVINFTLQVAEEETGLQSVEIMFGRKVQNGGDSYSVYPCLFSYVFDDPVYTGTVTFKHSVGGTESAGDYTFCQVVTTDYAGNRRLYSNGLFDGVYQAYKDSNGVYLPDKANNSKHCYISGSEVLTIQGSVANGTKLRVTSVNIKQTSLKKGGTTVLEMNVTNASAVAEIIADFYCSSCGYFITDMESNQSWSRNGNVITLKAQFPSAMPAGAYMLRYLGLRDTNGTWIHYEEYGDRYTSDSTGKYLPDVSGYNSKCYITGGKMISVQSDGDDEPPVLKSVKIVSTEVTKPGVIKVTVTAHDNNNIAKIRCTLSHEGRQDHGGYVSLQSEKTFTGKATDRTATLSFAVSSSTFYNKWCINQIEVQDSSGNIKSYGGVECEYVSIDETDEYPHHDEKGYYLDTGDPRDARVYYGTKQITLTDEFKVACQLGITNPKLVSRIKALKDGETAKIHVTSPYIARKELFDAIKGKNRTLVFYRDNYQWIFKGKNINQTKDVYLNIDFEVIDGKEYGGKNKMLEINFAPNGDLPGRANVRIKADFSYSMFKLDDSIYIYYNNKKKNQLEQENTSNAQLLDDTDRWLTFDVTHNSQFVASKEKLAGKKSKSMKVGTTYKSKQYKCYFKVTANKTLAYLKPMNKSVRNVSFPRYVKINKIRYSVESISKKAFKGCRSLKKVTGMDNIQKIGDSAFQGCTSLKKVSSCKQLVSVGKNAFKGCTSLTSFSAGIFLKSIGTNAFHGCKRLKKISFSGNMLQTIGTRAFSGCSKLTSFVIPSTVKKIGKQAFYNCKKLKNITINTKRLTAKAVGSKAFKGIAGKSVIKVPRDKSAEYTTLLKAKGLPKGAKIVN